MSRFYLALLLLVGVARASAAQTTPDPFPNTDRPPLGTTMTVNALGLLPSSGNVLALIETVVPDAIADRFDNGGLSTGDPARVGAHGSTWTQTTYRVGDADITDPGTSGTPLLTPTVAEWERVEVATGLMPTDVSAPGMSVGLVPRETAQWVRWLDVSGSPGGLNSDGAGDHPPPIVRMDSWAQGNLVIGGPLRDRVGLFASALFTRSSHFERTDPTPLDADLASLFTNVSLQQSPVDRLRFAGWVQGALDPLEHRAAFGQLTSSERRNGLHLQGTWERLLAEGHASLRTFGSITARSRSVDLHPTPYVVVDRLTDGPVPSLLDPGDGADRVLQVGTRYGRTLRGTGIGGHDLLAGAEWTRSSSSLQSAFAGRVGELVDGIPARAWDWTDPAAESQWHSNTLMGFIADTATLSPRVTINGALRFESVQGYSTDADSAAVTWNDLYPRAGLHVALLHFWEISTFVQYGRYGYRLPLRNLAWGDPTAPTASVYRWTGGDLRLPSSLGALVQRVGPGTGGRAGFSAIDPGLTRPAMNEMVLGFESRPNPWTFVRMAGIARRDWTLVGAVNVGVPKSSYTTVVVPDTGIDRIGAQDDFLLVFYNRDPSTFGQDKYLLTNPDDHVTTFVGVDFVGEVHAKRLYASAGGTAGRSEGLAANRGFGPLENDPGLIGEVFVNPNARDHAQGRFFTERGYTLKTAVSYQFDHDLTFGLIGRYQDGQHFARLVVNDTLNQGAEAVRAFRNGRTRFTFTMTVDGRLQKGFTIGGKQRFVATLDAYNIFNQSLSVEEDQVTGAGPRISTAVQPPRVIHIGVRIPF